MAIQKITYSNKAYINENASIAATNKVQATDMNEIKSVVNNNADLIYPVGTIITTNTNTNPSATYGGTWSSVECNLVIEKGDIVSGSPTNVSYGKYRVYANGDFEAWGFLNGMDIAVGNSITETIVLPYNVVSAAVIPSLAAGSAFWFTCQLFSYIPAGTNQMTMVVINTGSNNSTAIQPSFLIKGTVDLESNGIATKYCWRRVS
jgi:hypothetical protein